MSKKIFRVFSIFFLMIITLVACGDKGKIAIQVETQMKVGETYQIKYELENIEESIELSWKVSDTGMAELDSEKLTIKALKEGVFTLTVMAKTGEVASKEIMVEKGEGIAKYTILLELNGGELDVNLTEYDGLKDITLPIPKKEGYEFVGWYNTRDFSGNSFTEISKGETGNKTFYAKWKEIEIVDIYIIDLELNGGVSENIPDSYDGTVDIVLPIPTFAGYEFKGWYENPEFMGEPVEKILKGSTGNKEYYARWETIDYKITYELNGGEIENTPNSYTVESQTIVLQIPSKDGFVFKGWYETPEFLGEKIEKIVAGSTGDKELFAKWEEIKDEQTDRDYYIITYILNGGTMANAQSTYDGTEKVYLYTPLRKGYHFMGWYTTANFSGSPIDIIEEGTTGDITLYAKWVFANK